MKQKLPYSIFIIAMIVLLLLSPLFPHFYFSLLTGKAEKAALDHLKEAYKEEFTIIDGKYGRIRGESIGSYHINLISSERPNEYIHADIAEDMTVLAEDFKEGVWWHQTNKEYETLFKPFEKDMYGLKVNIHISDGVDPLILRRSDYCTYFNQVSNLTEEYVFLHMKEMPETERNQFLYDVIELMKERHLKNFMLEVSFFKDSIPEPPVDPLNAPSDIYHYRTFSFSLDTRSEEDQTWVGELSNPEQIQSRIISH